MLKMYLITYMEKKSQKTAIIHKCKSQETKTTNKPALHSMLNAKRNCNINSKSIQAHYILGLLGFFFLVSEKVSCFLNSTTQRRKMIKSLMCKNNAAQDSVGCCGTVLHKSHHRSPRQQEKTPTGRTILLNREQG